MNLWWTHISAICLAIPITAAMRIGAIHAGFLCLGLDLIFQFLGK